MASLLIGGIIATVIFVAIGTVLALPPYIKGAKMAEDVPSVLLAFSVSDSRDMPQWCRDFSALVEEKQLRAAIFFSGDVAKEYPECVRSFPEGVDIGSSTYTYSKLSPERDYLVQLEDVREGKAVIDGITGANSTLFKAPYGYTDDNIYSLLSRNGITADFSRTGSYNKYEQDQFIFFPLKTFDMRNSSATEIEKQIAAEVAEEIQVVGDNTVSVRDISLLVTTVIDKEEADFVNASDLTGMDLMSEEQ